MHPKVQLAVVSKHKTYMERCANTGGGCVSGTLGCSVLVPSNRIGKSDGNSSNRVNRTALSCSCA